LDAVAGFVLLGCGRGRGRGALVLSSLLFLDIRGLALCLRLRCWTSMLCLCIGSHCWGGSGVDVSCDLEVGHPCNDPWRKIRTRDSRVLRYSTLNIIIEVSDTLDNMSRLTRGPAPDIP
jgi:hypothetical protein